MRSFSILQMGRGSALNKRLFAKFLLYHYLYQGGAKLWVANTLQKLWRDCITNLPDHARIHNGDRGSGPTHLLKNPQNIGFLSNTGPDPLKITKLPIFNVGQHSAFNGVSLGGDDDVKVAFGYSLPSSTKKEITLSKLDPIWQKILDLRILINNILRGSHIAPWCLAIVKKGNIM